MGKDRPAIALALVIFCGAAIPLPAAAGDIPVHTAGTTFDVPITSLKELRFRRVVRQAYDFSCGSAAVATLLTYHYSRPTPEATVLQDMFEVGNQEKIKKEGFSMLDMKRYLASIGLDAEGYRVGLDKVAEVGVPGITLIETNGYMHFVVLKGIRGREVLVGDPALGTKVVSRDRFADEWNGIFFVITGKTDEAKDHFNSHDDWKLVAETPLAAAVATQSLADTMLSLPGPNQF